MVFSNMGMRQLLMAVAVAVFSLLWMSTKTAASNVTNCISDYNEFKNLTINHGDYGTRNRLKLFEAFYRPNHRLPFSVFVFYETVLPNGTTENITTGKCNSLTAWAWMSSPLFLVVRAEYLNRLAFYTLSHFGSFSTVKASIFVPQPCKKELNKLLSMLTSEVSKNDVCMHMHVIYVHSEYTYIQCKLQNTIVM